MVKTSAAEFNNGTITVLRSLQHFGCVHLENDWSMSGYTSGLTGMKLLNTS